MNRIPLPGGSQLPGEPLKKGELNQEDNRESDPQGKSLLFLFIAREGWCESKLHSLVNRGDAIRSILNTYSMLAQISLEWR